MNVQEFPWHCYNDRISYFDFLKDEIFTDFVQQFAILQVPSTFIAFLCDLHNKAQSCGTKKKKQWKPNQFMGIHFEATERHLPYRITQC